jgi:hypothetical protein
MNSGSMLTKAALQYQDRVDTTNAREALIKAKYDAQALYQNIDSESGRVGGFRSLVGKDAVDGYEQYKNGVKAVYDGYGATLGKNARAKYNAMYFAEFDSDLNKGSNHVVKQQLVHEKQVAYAAYEGVMRMVEDDPASAYTPLADGTTEFDRALSFENDPEIKRSRAQKVFQTGVESEYRKNGAEGARAYLDNYQQFTTPEGRNAADQWVDTKESADKKENERNARSINANALVGMRMGMPQATMLAVDAGNGEMLSVGFSRWMNRFDQSQHQLPPDMDFEKGFEMYTESLKESFQGLMLQGRSADYVQERWAQSIAEADAAGKPMDIELQTAGYEQLAKAVDEFNQGRTVTLHNQKNQVFAALQKGENPTSAIMGSQEIDAVEKDQLLKIVRNEQKQQFQTLDKEKVAAAQNLTAQYVVAAQGNELVPGSPKSAQLLTDLEEGRLNVSQYLQIQREAGKTAVSPAERDVRGFIKRAAREGVLTGGDQDVEVVTVAEGEAYQALDEYMQKNPDGNPLEFYKEYTQQAIERNRGFLGSLWQGLFGDTVEPSNQQAVVTNEIEQTSRFSLTPEQERAYQFLKANSATPEAYDRLPESTLLEFLNKTMEDEEFRSLSQ